MTSAIPYVMRLPARGQKDYMHASDVCLELLRLSSATTGIKFDITSRLDCAVEVQADDEQSSHDAGVAGKFSASKDGVLTRYRLVRRPDIPLIERRPDDLTELIAGYSVIGRSIESPRAGDKHFISQMIGLAVTLLHETVPGSTWWFSRLEVAQLPDMPSFVGCTIVNVVGKKFWNLHLFADGEPHGRLLMVSAQGAV